MQFKGRLKSPYENILVSDTVAGIRATITVQASEEFKRKKKQPLKRFLGSIFTITDYNLVRVLV
jgi:hypothetical protein